MRRWLTASAVWLACIGMVLPQAALAAPAPQASQPAPAVVEPPVPTVIDVALADGGTFVGQVVDRQGVPLAGTAVVVRQNEQEVASTVSDANGQFRLSGLRGGLYQVTAGQGVAIYRLWAPNTAPPTAQTSALIVSGNELVRGQGDSHGFLWWATNPWVLAGLIATAIAVPIILSNDHKSSS